jgi:hypothetical protein
MSTQIELDAAIETVRGLINQLVAEIPLLVAKVQANPANDFSSEVASLQAIGTSAWNTIQTVKPVTGQ